MPSYLSLRPIVLVCSSLPPSQGNLSTRVFQDSGNLAMTLGLSWQVSFKQEVPKIDWWVNRAWNPLAEVKLANLLVKEVDEETKSRLQVLGNIVVPAQAGFAAALLHGIWQLHLES